MMNLSLKFTKYHNLRFFHKWLLDWPLSTISCLILNKQFLTLKNRFVYLFSQRFQLTLNLIYIFSLLQNCSDKNGKHNTESKKLIKCSPWKHGFVQFLRKKKPSHPHRSQNNNDSVHSNHCVDSRNGHARLGCNSALLRTNQEDSSSEMETAFSPSPIPVFSG